MKSTNKKKETIEERLGRIEKLLDELSKRQTIVIQPGSPIPSTPYPPAQPPHYHGLIPCYQNPCYWA